MSEPATLMRGPTENFAAFDFRAITRTSDLSGFRSMPLIVNQSLTAIVHSSSFAKSASDVIVRYNCVSSAY